MISSSTQEIGIPSFKDLENIGSSQCIKTDRALFKCLGGRTYRHVFNADRRSLGSTWTILLANANTLIGGALNAAPANERFQYVEPY